MSSAKAWPEVGQCEAITGHLVGDYRRTTTTRHLTYGRESALDTVNITNLDRSAVVARAQVAESSGDRRRGLLGRSSLPDGEGLWIIPCESVHTIGMQFSIDVLFLSRDKRVLKIRPGMTAWRLAACLRAHSVLEVPAGTAAATGTRCGDRLEISASC